MFKYPTVLTIAGSDCSGGAGIQADIKAISATGVYAMSVITAITAQNTKEVSDVHPIPTKMIEQQIDAIFSDIRPDAIKIGMLFNADIIQAVIRQLKKWEAQNIILDPVMISTSGYKLISDEAIEQLVSQLMPMASLITPNKFEAECIAGTKINCYDDILRTANIIIKSTGCDVLIKGGHFEGNTMTDSLFVKGNTTPITFQSQKIETRNTHGTGCTLSSSIAAHIALGESLEQAIQSAKNYLQQALISGSDVSIGNGHGPVNHFYAPNKQIKYSL